ncbi:MAG TPA: quinone-dependent dihydroorotate dehydrogenase, partial [Planctomycetota bacterium]|nr:quinone-dependent dihydroorotate dehydrogenase [Planctomycetota bacterium]
MNAYTALLKPLLFRLDAEVAHNLIIAGLQRAAPPGLLRSLYGYANPALTQRVWGLDFVSPIGLAAGLDKNGVAIDALAACGFSHVEIGTVTGQGQSGNPKPRLFRLLDDQAVINRMGFNNQGAAAVAARLSQRYAQRRPGCVLGINLGKSKVVDLGAALSDYEVSVRALGALADYVVVNVSSPNTPGLRDLQGEAHLRPLLAGVRATLDAVAPGKPLLLKIAPDLSDDGIDAAVDVALETNCNGLIATNTTITRSGLRTSAHRVDAMGAGGLSGAPLRARATAVLARVARRVSRRVPVIGVGGVDSADAAWEKLSHGATLVQVYSTMVYHGPALA